MIHSPVLVINRCYTPIHITTAKRAFSLLYRGMAKALNERLEPFDFHAWCRLPVPKGGPSVGLVSRRVRIPTVILLTMYDQQPHRLVRFSRIRVLARDRYTCQYCGKTFPRRELNLDHVIPRRYGGTTTWDNVVCCCKACNRKKGGRTPEEAGMELIRIPRAPGLFPLAHLLPQPELLDEWKFLLPVRDEWRDRRGLGVRARAG